MAEALGNRCRKQFGYLFVVRNFFPAEQQRFAIPSELTMLSATTLSAPWATLLGPLLEKVEQNYTREWRSIFPAMLNGGLPGAAHNYV